MFAECRRSVNGMPSLIMGAVFIVKWEGRAPPDKAEWIGILRDTLASEVGSYRVVFSAAGGGWRFALEWREDEQARDEGLIANSPDSVAYNIYVNLAGGGKPIDPTWRPSASTASSS
jgi:hypothetical protein